MVMLAGADLKLEVVQTVWDSQSFFLHGRGRKLGRPIGNRCSQKSSNVVNPQFLFHTESKEMETPSCLVIFLHPCVSG